MITPPVDALHTLPGRPGPVAFVAPHALAPVEAALAFVQPEPAMQAAIRAHVAEWHDEGSKEALEAAVAESGCIGFRPVYPRGLLDLNRGQARLEAKETLFGKGAVSASVVPMLLPGAREALDTIRLSAMTALRDGSRDATAMVELHSYGDLGSTYDRDLGGRPVRRAEACLVSAMPWATAFPVGLARLIPADLRGAPWARLRRVGDALEAAGLHVGPHPYPVQGPWSVSCRFLAARWFRWLASEGRLPADTAERIGDLAWQGEQDTTVDAVVIGDEDEGHAWRGVHALGRTMAAWSHEGGALGDRFTHGAGAPFVLTVELRLDLIGRADALGRAVARAVAA